MLSYRDYDYLSIQSGHVNTLIVAVLIYLAIFIVAGYPYFKRFAFRRRGFVRLEYHEDVWIQMSENLSQNY